MISKNTIDFVLCCPLLLVMVPTQVWFMQSVKRLWGNLYFLCLRLSIRGYLLGQTRKSLIYFPLSELRLHLFRTCPGPVHAATLSGSSYVCETCLLYLGTIYLLWVLQSCCLLYTQFIFEKSNSNLPRVALNLLWRQNIAGSFCVVSQTSSCEKIKVKTYSTKVCLSDLILWGTTYKM